MNISNDFYGNEELERSPNDEPNTFKSREIKNSLRRICL